MSDGAERQAQGPGAAKSSLSQANLPIAFNAMCGFLGVKSNKLRT